MRILFLGDIVAKSGRAIVTKEVPRLRRNLKLDFIIANAENAAHGFGMTVKICDELFESGQGCEGVRSDIVLRVLRVVVRTE